MGYNMDIYIWIYTGWDLHWVLTLNSSGFNKAKLHLLALSLQI